MAGLGDLECDWINTRLARARAGEGSHCRINGRAMENTTCSGLRNNLLLVVLLLAAAQLLCAQAPTSLPFDVVITNGHIIDGSGSPWYSGDVGIRDGRIAAIGNLADAPAKRTIDAHGMVVAPGFIDMLGQSELTILVDPHLPSKIYQGITTEITGEGSSIAPLNDFILEGHRVSYQHYGVQPTWRTF